MSVSGIILVAAALGLSNFAAAIGIGLSGVDGRLRIRIAIIFGFFEAAMPLLGLLVGHRAAGSIGSAASYLGGGLLIATGLYAFAQAKMSSSVVAGPTNTGKLILTGAALSIDNLVVGFALGAYKVPTRRGRHRHRCGERWDVPRWSGSWQATRSLRRTVERRAGGCRPGPRRHPHRHRSALSASPVRRELVGE